MNKEAKERYARMQLKNGWDLPPGVRPPQTGRKRRLIRAYELIVLKTDEEYERDFKKPVNPPFKADEKKPVNAAPAQTVPEENTPKLETLSEEELIKIRRVHRIVAAAAVLFVVLAAGARILFGPAILLADISKFKDVEIEIEGMEDETVEVTIGELAKMKKTSLHKDVHNGELTEDEEPLSGDAIGPTLETLLKHYGKSVDDFRTMRVYGANDRSKAYVRTMKEEEIILSVADGRKVLGEKEAPLRIATDAEEPSEWFGGVSRIVFTK